MAFPISYAYPKTIFSVNYLSGTVNATGNKVAYIGRVWFPNGAYGSSKSIRKIGFRFGTVTKSGGSTVRVSLQDLDSSTVFQPFHPDGTQDQYYDILSSNSSYATNTFIMTGNLTSDRSVVLGETVAVVFEFDPSGRLGSDSFIITSPNVASGFGVTSILNYGVVSGTSGGSWTAVGTASGVLFEFSDGTYGTMEDGFPSSAISAASYNSSTNPNERGNRITVPQKCKTNGAFASMGMASFSSNFDICLYNGTTLLASSSIAGYQTRNTSTNVVSCIFDSEVTLYPSNTYYLSIKPTSANSVSPWYFSVPNASYFSGFDGGTDICYATRNGGAWTVTTTQRYMMGIFITSIEGDTSAQLVNSGGLVG